MCWWFSAFHILCRTWTCAIAGNVSLAFGIVLNVISVLNYTCNNETEAIKRQNTLVTSVWNLYVLFFSPCLASIAFDFFTHCALHQCLPFTVSSSSSSSLSVENVRWILVAYAIRMHCSHRSINRFKSSILSRVIRADSYCVSNANSRLLEH